MCIAGSLVSLPNQTHKVRLISTMFVKNIISIRTKKAQTSKNRTIELDVGQQFDVESRKSAIHFCAIIAGCMSWQ